MPEDYTENDIIEDRNAELERILVDSWEIRYPTSLVLVQDYEEASAIIREVNEV